MTDMTLKRLAASDRLTKKTLGCRKVA